MNPLDRPEARAHLLQRKTDIELDNPRENWAELCQIRRELGLRAVRMQGEDIVSQ